MKSKKKTILIIMGRYLPGYKDGGPVRSVKNLIDYMGDEYDFRIMTSDRDHGDSRPYEGIRIREWNCIDNAEVYYIPEGEFRYKEIVALAASVDTVYVCGCFSRYAIYTMLAKKTGAIRKPVIIAAMGLFSPLEFRRKYLKKKLFVVACKMLGLFRNIYWSATSEMEVKEIRQQVGGREEQYLIAEDLPRKVNDIPIKKVKESGTLKVVWISRIFPKKNLLGAIEILEKVSNDIHFTIIGPIHDASYWAKCEKKLEKLHSNISWEYIGNIESEQVVDVLKQFHVFLFPTYGENYGHVIQEALSAGCPCILSDQTPWQDLGEHHAGFVISLARQEMFATAIEEYAEMNQSEFQAISESTHRYAMEVSNQKSEKSGYRHIFDDIV